MKKKAVISVGCGESQLLVIQAAVDLGFSVIGLDKNENAIGRALCDEFCCRSTHNFLDFETSLLNYTYSYEIVGILNRSSGTPVITVAEISKYLKLNYYSSEAAETVINKHQFFTFLSSHNFASPATQVRSKDAIVSGDVIINYPCLVKPSLSTVGKSGIYKVSSSSKLEEFIQKSFKSTDNEYVLVQNYLEGKDVALISMVIEGQLYVYEIIEEVNSVLNEKINGKGVLTPARIDIEQRNELINTAKTLAKKLNIINSPFMLSFRIDKGKAYIMELHLDFGGDLILDVLLPLSTKRNVAEDLIKALLFRSEFSDINPSHVYIEYNEGAGLNSSRGYHVAEGLTEISKLLNEN